MSDSEDSASSSSSVHAGTRVSTPFSTSKYPLHDICDAPGDQVEMLRSFLYRKVSVPKPGSKSNNMGFSSDEEDDEEDDDEDEDGAPTSVVLHSHLTVRDPNSSPPLLLAVLRGNVQCAALLLEADLLLSSSELGPLDASRAPSGGAILRFKADGGGGVAHAIACLAGVDAAKEAKAVELYKLVSKHPGFAPHAASKDDNNLTPMYIAACSDSPKLLEVMVSEELERVQNTLADSDEEEEDGAKAPSLPISVESPSGKISLTAAQFETFSNYLNQKGSRTNSRPLHAVARFGRLPSLHVLAAYSVGGKPILDLGATDAFGQTALHVAYTHGNFAVSHALLHDLKMSKEEVAIVDRKGRTAEAAAKRRGVSIPAAKKEVEAGGRTALLTHELFLRHQTCPHPIKRGGQEPPPENVGRLSVLINEEDGILKGKEFVDAGVDYIKDPPRAAMADVLRVHSYNYVSKVSKICANIPDHPMATASIDPDTAVSRWSFESAMHAAGAVCQAVDLVMGGGASAPSAPPVRNAFCAVRPPGHHAGPYGTVKCENDPDGSHGFCLLNNVAIGAAYARNMYRDRGIKRVAIVDFDVHHGNGTEEIVRGLLPKVESTAINTPFGIVGNIEQTNYRPWLDESDVENVFFSSIHGFGPRDNEVPREVAGWFYPASGESVVTKAFEAGGVAAAPASGSSPSSSSYASRMKKVGFGAARPPLTVEDLIQSQTWTKLGAAAAAAMASLGADGAHSDDSESGSDNMDDEEDSDASAAVPRSRRGADASAKVDPTKNCCKIINCALALQNSSSIPGMQRVDMRDAYRKVVLPQLLAFKPDMIFISAGFDAHRKDAMNFGYVGMVEDDYEWVTERLVEVANKCCEGRIVSVLEGGYKIHGGLVSPFARSVASHVRALVDGARWNRETFDIDEVQAEGNHERFMVEERERKRLLKEQKDREALFRRSEERREREMAAASEHGGEGGGGAAETIEEDGSSPSKNNNKRRRTAVDYAALNEKIEEEKKAKTGGK